jgi:hypothetical protein
VRPPNDDPERDWDPDAVPGLAPPPPEALSEQVLVVDGERFVVREHPRQGGLHVYSYDWLTGPNARYGFGSGGPEQQTSEHVAAIRAFLRDIDPATGYLSEPDTER